MIFVVELAFRAEPGSHLQGLREHRAYWDGRARDGVLIDSGPWQDGSGELLLCRAPDRAAMLRILDQDPYLRSRAVARIQVRAWEPVGRLAAPAGSTPPGARPAGPRRGTRACELTPHEERVAAMAVDGMTNRGIAEALSVSTRAVELQITRIYLKLSIRRRAQLAPALSRHRDAADRPPESSGTAGTTVSRSVADFGRG
ncbi:LuxR C-terminal-related transcriptional regulator [Kitasatospora indigofera]|uniref:LuxR C-terminal-related transcriptional regulator n=1 Tax=Kitasatospora indigofera TaxID=67307 RepID=UPI003666DF7A